MWAAMMLTICSLGSGMRRSSIYVGPRCLGCTSSDSLVPIYSSSFRFRRLWFPLQIYVIARETHRTSGVSVFWSRTRAWRTRGEQGMLHTMKFPEQETRPLPRREKRLRMTKSRQCSTALDFVYFESDPRTFSKLSGKWGLDAVTQLLSHARIRPDERLNSIVAVIPHNPSKKIRST